MKKRKFPYVIDTYVFWHRKENCSIYSDGNLGKSGKFDAR